MAVAPEPARLAVPTLATTLPVTQIMTREVECARQDVGVDRVLEVMIGKRIGCMPIVNSAGRPVGIVTKLDLIEQLIRPERDIGDMGAPLNLQPETARELMMPIAITIDQHATIAHAAALMASEDVHHLPIVDGTGRLVGLLSTMDIVRWLAKNDGYGA